MSQQLKEEHKLKGTPVLGLCTSTLGLFTGLTTPLYLYYPNEFDSSLFPLLFFFGVLCGAGGATFTVDAPKTSYWFPKNRQGYELGVMLDLATLAQVFLTMSFLF